MKHLTRKQKILAGKAGLHPGSYLLVSEDAATMILFDKSTGTLVTVPKR